VTVTPNPTRRDFLKTSAAVSGGLVIAFVAPGAKRFALAAPAPGADPFVPNAFLRIGSDDTITVLSAHSEMGQGIWTSLPMLIAEELDADWSKIKVEHAPAAPVYAHTAFGIQVTGGSSTTWSEFQRYREAGALARSLLVEAAAQRFGVPASDCRTENGVVMAGRKRASYGKLADAAAQLPAPASVKLKDVKDWKIIGKPTKRLDTPEKITGRARFGMDVQFDGLLTAVVARSPVFGGKVKSFDATKAEAEPGVREVVQVPSGVAVLADHFWAASRGRAALEIEWDPGTGATLDSDALRQEFSRQATTPGLPAANAGDVDAAMPTAATKIEAEYAVPYLAHAPMEPLNCTVRIGPDKCEIWTGTQFQGQDQQLAAKITGLSPEQIEIHTTFLGGGFGRRANATSDFVVEAVHVAKNSRRDGVRGGVGHQWDRRSLRRGRGRFALLVGDPESPDRPPFSQNTDHGSVVALGGTHPQRLRHGDTDRRAGTDGRPGSGRLPPPPAPRPSAPSRRAESGRREGRLGIALTPGPGARGGGARIVRQLRSRGGRGFGRGREDPGAPGGVRHRLVNPETIAAQMESGVAFGLSAALHSKLTVKEGRVQESNYHDYVVLRMNEMPRVETHIVPSVERLGGVGEVAVPPIAPAVANAVGEVAVPPIAPAVANAVAALTSRRLRELPLRLQG
jgi:isoquinoline 1-oxidoreductase beta subunit